ncbi:hypothetical protein FQN55_000942 [Onygenales sp. PD_40]|nr:hypothetical protein FQN55_000942 [Onygenales sp. PD_40]
MLQNPSLTKIDIPALLQNPFQLDYPTSSESEYIGAERTYSGSTSFPTEDVETDHQRTGSLGNQLAHPVSVPVSNGFRFHAAPGLLMSPVESSNGSSSTSPSSASSSYAFASLSNVLPTTVTSNEGFSASSAYSQPSNLQWNDRMADYRVQRVPALQPPSGMSPPLQSQGAVVPGSSGLMTRSDPYSMSYATGRSTYSSPHNIMNDMTRYSQYPATRTMDISSNASASTIYGGHMLDHSSRSSQSGPEAPPFHETNVLHSILTNNHQTINPEITAKIHKGFFPVDEKWTCYRRNYFSVSCSFSLRPWAPGTPLYIQLANEPLQTVRSFAMSISAVVNGHENETRELVQHTPKRDKQSEKKPGKVALQPSHPPSLVSHSQISFAAPPHTSTMHHMDYGASYGASQQAAQTPTTYTFERIQFQKATANNGKRRAQQQYYNLVVELYAEVPLANGVESRWVLIAKRLSHSMVVRGRSPGHYKDGRRDGSTSMGPDGGTGSSGDGNGGSGLHSGMGHGARTHLSLMSYDTGHRGAPFSYRRFPSTDHSPLAASPLISSSSSSPDYNNYTMISSSMDPVETLKDTTAGGYGDATFTTASPDARKICIEPANLRLHLPSFEDGTAVKAQEDHEGSFNGGFDPMITTLQNEHEGSSGYLKRHGTAPFQSPGPKFGASYPTRSVDSTYGRFDTIHNPQSLCS